MKIFSIAICFCAYSLYTSAALSPRILIVINKDSTLTAEDITLRLESHIISKGSFDELKEAIYYLDHNSKSHRIIISGTVEDIAGLARKVGYDYLEVVHKNIDEACFAILEKEKTIPTTDAYMKRTDEHTAGLLYHLMKLFHDILKKLNLLYWVTDGTLLGAVRHGGLIPWDDDLDVCMFENDVWKLLTMKNFLNAHGLEICNFRHSWYKVFFKNGKKIKMNQQHKKIFNNQEYYPWTFPNMDIFPMRLEKENKINYSSFSARNTWKNEYFLLEELQEPLNHVTFGPMFVPVPHNYINIVQRLYGPDWNELTYAIINHEHEQELKKIKVALVDHSQTPYILPTVQNLN